MLSYDETPGGYVLVGLLGVLLVSLIVHEEACTEPAAPPALEETYSFKAAGTFGSKIGRQVANRSRDQTRHVMDAAAGELGAARYLTHLNDARQRPAVPCASRSESTLSEVVFEPPVDVLHLTSRQFVEQEHIRLPYDVSIEASAVEGPLTNIELDELSGCRPPRQVLLTIFTESLGHRYRFSTCAPTPGRYDPEQKTWSFDGEWEEFEFGWHGRMSNFSPALRKDAWLGGSGPFPPGTTRFMVELSGTRHGDRFAVRMEYPIVIGPFATDLYRCREVPETDRPTTAYDAPSDEDDEAAASPPGGQ